MKKLKLSAIEKPKLFYKKPKDVKEYLAAMKKQNDSLRSLPVDDPYHLPTFEDSPEGRKKRDKFYTPSPDNKKLKNIQQLGKKLRKKYL
tara:strand:- start:591 stop:857 length:267 start_codon:yes stop_codon:yes gene_type:complete